MPRREPLPLMWLRGARLTTREQAPHGQNLRDEVRVREAKILSMLNFLEAL